jgi:tRNA uridine 5-carboxymethylaminomethyl modification enzyme
MTRAGYAIEYDFLPPTQLDPSLQLRGVDGLYFAGQVNGTTGYEEAAGQGVIAGANAALGARGDQPAVLRRDEAMIGVLIDDLVTRGTDEPYRLFTSRAEYRLLLRQDNALRRLVALATRLGLIHSGEQEIAETQLKREEEVRRVVERTQATPTDLNPTLESLGLEPIGSSIRLADLVRRPGVRIRDLCNHIPGEWSLAEFDWADIELKYEGYLLREREAVARLEGLESMELDSALPYSTFGSLSIESRQKLCAIQPATMGRAGRIPGVSPSDLQNLALEVLKWRRGREAVKRPS